MYNAREGELYKVIEAGGRTFELRYGYYEEYERESPLASPIPIYPDFKCEPEYTEDGKPFVTQMQELCEFGESAFSDGCCVDCKYYEHLDELLGICLCEKNKNKNKKEKKL